MSNVFFVTKKHLPDSTKKKIINLALKYNFLAIGNNTIGKYHTFQYRGPTNNLNLFRKGLSKIIKNNISGNQSFLQKPSEKEFQVSYDKDITSNKEPVYSKKIKLKKIIKPIKSLKKTKYGYHLPILLFSLINGHPQNVKHDIFFTIKNNEVTIHSHTKHPLIQTEAWLNRLEMLL